MKFTNPRDPENVEITRTIKKWVLKHLNLPEGTGLWVSEVNCLDENCPDMETLILILPENKEKFSLRIRKPLTFVRERDIISTVTG